MFKFRKVNKESPSMQWWPNLFWGSITWCVVGSTQSTKYIQCNTCNYIAKRHAKLVSLHHPWCSFVSVSSYWVCCLWWCINRLSFLLVTVISKDMKIELSMGCGADSAAIYKSDDRLINSFSDLEMSCCKCSTEQKVHIINIAANLL